MKPARILLAAPTDRRWLAFGAFVAAAVWLLVFVSDPLRRSWQTDIPCQPLRREFDTEQVDTAFVGAGTLPLPKLATARQPEWPRIADECPGESCELARLARDCAAQRSEDYGELHASIDRWRAEVRALQARPELWGRDSSGGADDLQRAALTLQTIDAELRAICSAYQCVRQQTKRDYAALAACIEQEQVRTEIAREIGPMHEHHALQGRLALKKLTLAGGEQRQLEALIANSFGLSQQRLGRHIRRSLGRR